MSQPSYQTWFNTPYYHDLNQHRDLNEAKAFIVSLCQKLGAVSYTHLTLPTILLV